MKLDFLPNTTLRFDSSFAGSDSPVQFRQRLANMPADWHYRTKEISYISNRHGYRTVEFDAVDWENSIVLFGCSHVFGVGLAEDETLGHHLHEKLGHPVINMGCGGASTLYSLYNQMTLHQAVKPRAVVNLWTSSDRLTVIAGKLPLNINAFSQATYKTELFRLWNLHAGNSVMFSLLLQHTARLMWNDIPHVEATFFESTASELACELIEYQDYARDLTHPGPNTIREAANIISSKLANNVLSK